MMTDDRDDIVYLVDEDGNELPYTVIHEAEVHGKRYAILVPVPEGDADIEEMDVEEFDVDPDEVAILRIETDENGDDILVDIEDDEEYEDVFDHVSQMFEEEFDEEFDLDDEYDEDDEDDDEFEEEDFDDDEEEE